MYHMPYHKVANKYAKTFRSRMYVIVLC